MSLEVRKVPANWEHPKDEREEIIPLHSSLPYNQAEIEEGLEDGWLENSPPHYGIEVMPEWPESERIHFQMYERTTYGTPISPVMETAEELAQWLADNTESEWTDPTASYDDWLRKITWPGQHQVQSA